MFVDVFTTENSGTYTTSVELWLQGQRFLAQAEWSRVAPESEITITLNRRPTLTLPAHDNPTIESVETAVLAEIAVTYHGVNRSLAEAVTERSKRNRAGNAQSNRSRYLRKIMENHHALDTWQAARAGDRRYFRYALMTCLSHACGRKKIAMARFAITRSLHLTPCSRLPATPRVMNCQAIRLAPHLAKRLKKDGYPRTAAP